MTRVTRAAWLLPCLIPLAAPLPAHDPAGEAIPQVAVRGHGEVRAAPDEAGVRLGIEAQDATARAAQERASATAAAILTAVGEAGVERDDVQTAELMLYPVQAQEGPEGEPRAPRIVGYRASNVVTVRVRDLGRLGAVVDAGIRAGANRVEGVDFRLRDDLAARERALALAVGEARRKAQVLASAAGVQLGEVQALVESGVEAQPFFAQPRMMAMESMAADTPVAPGEIVIRADVELRYRLRPR
jgi:uncharacterized protein YggE